MSIGRLTKYLDRVSFLGFGIWDFCFRSLFTEYGCRFLKKAVLAHPLKTGKGLLKYRNSVPGSLSSPDLVPWSTTQESIFLEKIRKEPSNLLIGLGFCLKPYHPDKPAKSCPSGRANHDCLYLEKGEIRPICLDCAISKISRESLERDFRVYIMTSAVNMAQDYLIPQITEGKFPLSLLLLCPYSIRAILPALYICEAESHLFPYSKGNCLDYRQWRKADLGQKEEVTELDSATWKKMLCLFEKIEPAAQRSRNFIREGNVFSPERSGL